MTGAINQILMDLLERLQSNTTKATLIKVHETSTKPLLMSETIVSAHPSIYVFQPKMSNLLSFPGT